MFGSVPLAIDAHIDTVGISNPTRWKYDPFRGVVSGGILFGRGASDQKGGLAAVVHGVALAAIQGRDYVIPDDIQALAPPTLAHRVIVRPAPAGRLELEVEPAGIVAADDDNLVARCSALRSVWL